MPIGVRVVTIFVWSRLTSERRASNQRNQRESSDKHLHDTSPCYGRSSVGCCNSGEADGDRQRDALARRGRQRALAERAGPGAQRTCATRLPPASTTAVFIAQPRDSAFASPLLMMCRAVSSS